METMKSLTPELTLFAPSSAQSASLDQKCASLTLRGLKALANAYIEAARFHAYWIGYPGPYSGKDRA